MRIIVEGLAGEGKTTVAWAIFCLLNRAGFKVVLKDDTDGTPSMEGVAQRKLPRGTTVLIETHQTRTAKEEADMLRALWGEAIDGL